MKWFEPKVEVDMLSEAPYRLVYDALVAENQFTVNHVIIAVVVGMALTGIAWRVARRSGSAKRWFVVAWLAAATFLGSLVMSGDLVARDRCHKWLRAGDFEVVEGSVENFVPMPKEGHADESFSVRGRSFRYSDYDRSQCGFNNAASHGGPIKEGLNVRIAHHGPHILRLEIENR